MNFQRAMVLKNSQNGQLSGYDWRINIEITRYPQFQLYLLTLRLLKLKNQLIPQDCDEMCIYSTIINRAYFSLYLFCELWLEDVKNFKLIPIKEFGDDEVRISEHLQVRNALYNFGEKIAKTDLDKLARLRKKLIIILLEI